MLTSLNAVTGRTVGENLEGVNCWNKEVITPLKAPFKDQGGIVVLKGNLAPNGAVLKPSAATPRLMQHKGKAVVFESIEDLRYLNPCFLLLFIY